jgi:AraC-like DNA-binding protein/tetratricopeptide (TPR) repeat protein
VIRYIRRDIRRRTGERGGLVLQAMTLKLCDGDVTMAGLWSAAGLPRDGDRTLARALGTSPWSYFVERRLEACARLLLDPRLRELSCAVIAAAAGFKRRYSTFAEQFKEWSGQTPGAFRRQPDRRILARLRRQNALWDEDADEEPPPAAPSTVGALLQASRDAVADRRPDAAVANAVQALAVVEEHGPADRARAAHAEAAVAYQVRAGRRLQRFDAEAAWEDVGRAASHYEAAGGWSPRVETLRRTAVAPADPRRPLLQDLCERCRPRLLDDGETCRALDDVLGRVHPNLPFFVEACDRCATELWRQVDRARRALEPNAWRAAFLAEYSDDPDDDAAAPSESLFIQLLDTTARTASVDAATSERRTRRAVEVARALSSDDTASTDTASTDTASTDTASDGEREAAARLAHAAALVFLGDVDAALLEIDAVDERPANPWLRTYRLGVLAGLQRRQGNPEAAVAALAEAFAVCRGLDEHLAGLTRMSKGDAYLEGGRPAEALQALDDAAELIDARRDPLAAGAHLPIRRAAALNRLERFEEAEEALGRCDYERASQPAVHAEELLQRGAAALGQDDLGTALRDFGDARQLAEDARQWRDAGVAALYSLEIHVRRGDRVLFPASMSEAMKAFEAAGHDARTREALEHLALLVETDEPDDDAIVEGVRRLLQDQKP